MIKIPVSVIISLVLFLLCSFIRSSTSLPAVDSGLVDLAGHNQQKREVVFRPLFVYQEEEVEKEQNLKREEEEQWLNQEKEEQRFRQQEQEREVTTVQSDYDYS
ncbi:forkhead box protein P1-like [Topomyia yanbarensis]|uniref:forkhead box protein P1-like n=1 Tax=Topomyia yanbarensis TaxID=2498891 RepID=UPI00273C2A43|nr:forkhead box protein P1-like [Topomyia yanbarensis]